MISLIRPYRLALILTLSLITPGCQQDKQIDSGFISVVVVDFDRSIQWYTNNLDFEVIDKTENPERRLKQANLKYHHINLELIELGSAIKPSSLLDDTQNRVIFQGLFKAGFTIDAFEEKISIWQENGVTSKDQVVKDPVTNKRMVVLRDPDGNRIQIFEK
ncbi:MAG: VOC family protein [Flavobacteriaceae bacterium]|nr:VOC family protein [Flavobacteriaceae bacterium]